MSDERLEKLGNYFCHFKIFDRYGMTFERFVELVVNGIWKDIVKGGL
jgi:hypothetical protein